MDPNRISAGARAARPRAINNGSEHDETGGEGWVIFAGIVIMIAGTLNFIYGLAATSNSPFYATGAHLLVGDLDTWGWFIMGVGILQLCASLGIWARAAWARWACVILAFLSAVGQLVVIAAEPLLALSIFTLDVLVIYGLVAHGGRQSEVA